MNLSEFKAWFEGFTDGMDSTPNEKQWAKIKKRVGEITKDPTPWPVYVERYWPTVDPWYRRYYSVGSGVATYSAQSAQDNTAAARAFNGTEFAAFVQRNHATADSAFRDLGRADRESISG